ncbi:MAG TPA: hypothetical protein VIW27_04535 [Gammaproteobacteria bacterium]|jgi:hypothetical protein
MRLGGSRAALSDVRNQRSGQPFGRCHQVGENLKLGVGHDFTDFADGSPDLDFDNQDFFGNVTSKL